MVSADATLFSIMVLDVEGFGKRVNPLKGTLREDVYDLAQNAAADAGLEWDEFGTNDTGDGMLLVIPPSAPPARLAGSMLHGLAERLRLRPTNESTTDAGSADALRLRISLHHGLVHRDGRGWYGDAVDFAFRLVEAGQVRNVLAAAEVSGVAFIVSDEVYQSVIRHGYRLVDPARYGQIRFAPKHQQDVSAWVYVPGYAFPPGLPPLGEDERSTAEAAVQPSSQPTPPAVHNHNEAAVVMGDQIGVKNITVTNPGSVRL